MTDQSLIPTVGTKAPRKRKNFGGPQKGSGRPKNLISPNLFKNGNASKTTVSKPIRDALIEVGIQISPNKITYFQEAALKLWAMALTGSEKDKFKAIIEIFDRIEGKAMPSSEELEKMGSQFTIVMPNIAKQETEPPQFAPHINIPNLTLEAEVNSDAKT